MGVIDIKSLGESRPASPAEADIVAAALAGLPGAWQSVRLTEPAMSGPRFGGVLARLGAEPMVEPPVRAVAADSARGPEAAAPLIDEASCPAPEVLAAEPVEGSDIPRRFQEQQAFRLQEPTAMPRSRVVRRMLHAGQGSQSFRQAEQNYARREAYSQHGTLHPMPGFHYAATQMAGRSPVQGDRSGYFLVVFLMFALWAGVVGGAAMFFTTPRSGMKIEWR